MCHLVVRYTMFGFNIYTTNIATQVEHDSYNSTNKLSRIQIQMKESDSTYKVILHFLIQFIVLFECYVLLLSN